MFLCLEMLINFFVTNYFLILHDVIQAVLSAKNVNISKDQFRQIESFIICKKGEFASMLEFLILFSYFNVRKINIQRKPNSHELIYSNRICYQRENLKKEICLYVGNFNIFFLGNFFGSWKMLYKTFSAPCRSICHCTASFPLIKNL